MANWRSCGDRMLHCRRSMLKTWSECSNSAAKFHHSACGGGSFISPVRSSEYFLRLGGRSVGVLRKGATFSLNQCCFSSSVAVVEKEEARGPLPLGLAPCLMLPAGSGLVAQRKRYKLRYKLVRMEEERDYYQFFSLCEKKVVKMRKNLRLMLPWQREILTPDEAICFGSSRGWLAFIHPRNCSLYLFNPFIHSYLPYLPLPPIQTLPSIVSCVRYNSNFHTPSSPFSSSSSSSSINNTNIVTEFTIWNRFSPMSSQDLNAELFFKKIVLSSAPAPFPSNHHSEDISNTNKYSSECTVMAIQGYRESELAFCRIGDTAWTALDGPADSYKDLIYFSKDQNFYALSTDYDLVEAWDLRNPASPKNTLIISHLPPLDQHPTMDQHQRKLRHRRWDRDHYLVESSGDLLMVVRYSSDHSFDENGNYRFATRPKKTFLFDVYKLDFVNKEWLLWPSLGDRALFVGINDSVSLSTSDFPALAKNSIYFTCPDAGFPQNSHDLGIFNLEDNTITPIFHYDLKIQLPSIWIVPPQQ